LNLLVLRTSAFGDILHILPALQALKSTHPKVHITLLTRPGYHSVFERVSFLDRLVSSPPGDTDIVVDAQGLMRTAWLSLRCGAWLRVGYSWSEAREPMASIAYQRRVTTGRTHIMDRHAFLLSAALGSSITISPEYRATDLVVHTPAVDEVLPSLTHPCLLVHPTTSDPEKDLREEEWSPILLRFLKRKWSVVLSCGPGEEDRLSPWVRALPSAFVLPVLSFGELAAILTRCRLYLGGDTGPTHLADQLGIPVMGTFTRWHPDRNGPYFSPSLIYTDRTPDLEEVDNWVSRHCS